MGDTGDDATHGRWRRIAERLSVRPRRVWVGTAAVLLIMALGNLAYNDGLTTGNGFRDDVESVKGQELIDASFPGGANAPTEVVVPRSRARGRRCRGARGHRGRGRGAHRAARRRTACCSTPCSRATRTTRTHSRLIPADHGTRRTRPADEGTLVGGATAVEYDVRQANKHDAKVIVPLTLTVVFIVLILLCCEPSWPR